MNTGPNHPGGGPGGRGRRRRRGRRGQGSHVGQQQGGHQQGRQQQQGTEQQATPPTPQGSTQQGSQQQGRRQQRGGPHQRHGSVHQQGRRHGGGQQQRQQGGQHRPPRPAKQRHPDAEIYTAPMDHSYRAALQNGNGNGNLKGGRQRPGFGPKQFSQAEPEPLPMRDDGPARIYAFVDDLFFLAKIQETARKLNVKVEIVKAGDKEILERLDAAEEKPSLIIFDLNNVAAKPLSIIPKLRSKLKKATNIIGFLSHVQGDLKIKAQEAGCDMVVPRSAFSQNLPQILRRHGAPEGAEEAEI